MLEHGRYLSADEMQILIERARRMRSQYVAALALSAVLRAKQFFARTGGRRGTSAPRYFPDVG